MILTLDSPEWDEYIGRMPKEKQDIYFTSKYHQIWDIELYGEARMFVYEEDDKTGIYPYRKHAIWQNNLQGKYFDIETVYGYGGPLVNTEDKAFIARFEDAFLEHCRSENIIAEFVRFHPIIGNEKVFRKDIQVLHNRKTVVLDLTQDIEEIWMKQISTQNRNIIRKCIKNNLMVEQGSRYDEFIEIYSETMKRVGAEEFYSFGKEYYDNMQKQDNYTLLYVREGDRAVAGAIFMGYGDYFHYHLSGSRKDALKLCPNNILLWEAIQYAKQKGYKKFHFGGGLTDSMEDNLFRFKSKFSKEYIDFYIGKRVHNRETYTELIKSWEEEHGEKAARLLQYRE